MNNITIYNYIDQSIADSISAQAAERATAKRLAEEAAKAGISTANVSSGEDFATVLQRIANGETTAFGESGTATKLYSNAEMEPIFQEAANAYGISADLLKAVGKTESAFNANAVSKSGAMGVMQLMPATASYLGVTNAFDAYQNIMGGARYLSELLNKYNGSVTLALAAYNGGSNNVDTYGGVPPFTETQNYVKKVLSYLAESVSAEETEAAELSEAKYQVNNALETFFASNNISKTSLELLTTLLEVQDSIEKTNTEEGIV